MAPRGWQRGSSSQTKAHLRLLAYLFASRVRGSPHISTRQYARIVHHWIDLVGLDASDYRTHSLRRTKASLIYNRAVARLTRSGTGSINPITGWLY